MALQTIDKLVSYKNIEKALLNMIKVINNMKYFIQQNKNKFESVRCNNLKNELNYQNIATA